MMKKDYVSLFLFLVFTLGATFAQVQSQLQAQEHYTADQIKDDFDKWLPMMGAPDSQIQERETAQQGWQKYCMYAGAPDKPMLRIVVNTLMIEQLDKDIPVLAKVWFLHELAWTAGATEVPAIAKLLNDPQVKISDEAARTLAKIPGAEAEDALKNALKNDPTKRIANALKAREAVSPKLSTETKMPLAIPYTSEAELDQWMKGYEQWSDLEKASTIRGLAVRKAKKYYPMIFDALKSDNEDLRRSAMLATEKIGGKDQIASLMDCVSFDRGVAVRVLSNLVGEDVDKELFAELQKTDNTDKIVLISEILGNRYNPQAIPAALEIAKQKDFGNRIAVFNAVSKIANKTNLKDLLDVMLLITDRRDRDTAENAIAKICAGDATPIVEKLSESNALDILPLLGRIGGTEALEAVEESLKLSNREIHNAAVRALANWPNATAAEKMLNVANDTEESPQNRISALRGYIRVMSLPRNEIGIAVSEKDKLEHLKKVFAQDSTRRSEKTLILERIAAIRIPESVQFAMGYLNNAEFQATAAQTIVDLAHYNELRLPNKELFTKALDQVIEIAQGKDLKERNRQKRPLDDAAKWYKSNM